jgi:phosphotransferase family enzyme
VDAARFDPARFDGAPFDGAPFDGAPFDGAPFDAADVTMAARAATGRPDAVVAESAVTPASHRPDNMTTAGLDLVRGTLVDGAPFALFVKTLRPASASPHWSSIPEFARPSVLLELDWHDEPSAYRSALRTDLPAGLRMPRLWHVVETEQQIQLWLEHVDDQGVWDADGYHRAATALGRLCGRWPGTRVAAELGLRRRGLAYLWYGKTSQVDLPRLADDSARAHPAFDADPGLRADLRRVIDIVPSLIKHLDQLPDALCHGDACPANLLHVDDGIVAIDWSYASSSSIGSDLGQLLAGGFVNGSVDSDRIAATAQIIRKGFVSGLVAEGVVVDEDAIEHAFITHLLVRAVFDAVANIPDVAPRVAAARVALARFAADRVLALALQSSALPR